MNRKGFQTFWRWSLGLLVALAGGWLHAADSATVKKIFADPPRQYASAPLWVWNDMLTEDQVRRTLRDLAGQKVKQAFVHPRPGLMTPYLGDDWFRLWKVALDEAEKLDMNIWIYDENSYPSGFAGGHVPEVMPESRGRGLVFREEKQPGRPGPEVIAIYRITPTGFENVTQKACAGENLPEGRYTIAAVQRAGNSPWFGDRCYVDLMYPGVTEKFLEITLGAYQREIGGQFGKRVPGSFTDEPNIRPAGGLPWTDHLPEAFQKRWGYSLLDHLPSLIRPVGQWKQVRHDYYQVLLEQYIEHWAKPYSEYCEKLGIAFTGHYWDHEWPNCLGVPDNMAMYAWQHIPGIDCLMNQYAEHTHAQFGNVRMVKELASVANQLGKGRTLCELYGAGGWDLRLEDMKRIGDWLEVLGVNLLDEHLSYVTIRGARKADHPQSFSYHEPWWDSYHVVAGYFTRLTAAMCHGQQVNKILVIEPTTTAWMYQADSTQAAFLGQIGKSFFDLLMSLERAQVEYDLGCEEVIAHHASVEGSQFRVGRRGYEVVVLPPMTETLRGKTVDLLDEYVKGGGRVISCGPAPALVDGRPSQRAGKLAQSSAWRIVEPGSLWAILQGMSTDGFAIRRAADDKGLLFHHRRRLEDGELLLLVNTSIDHSSSGEVLAPKARSVERWDCRTGAVKPYPSVQQINGELVTAAWFELPPCGSLLLWISKSRPGSPQQSAPAPAKEHLRPIAPVGPLQVRRLEPNVLTLDYMDVAAGGESLKSAYFYQANQFAFQKNGMARNPWDSAVQFKDELIRKTFPPESGLEATYRFTIEGPVPKPLWIVVERPDLYTITCNGQPVAAAPESWWLDRAFGRIDITAAARTGENAVTIKAQPFTIYHELEPAYVLGDFSLRATDSGFVIVPPQPLRVEQGITHSNQLEGVHWLSAGIGFGRDPSKPTGNDPAPWVVFDLGRPLDLKGIHVWNYNEVNLTGRGVKGVEITASKTGAADSFTIPIGRFELARAPGSSGSDFSQTLKAEANAVRFVRFRILSNHTGVTYPADGSAPDNAFAGLSEVQFFAAADRAAKPARIEGVTIHSVSSELVGTHDRAARHLVDGSGLGKGGIGWNQQGCPFYAAGVAYTQTFQIAQPAGKYRVAVPNWYGSVAKVSVNGKLCGHLAWQPWECDVTEAIQPGNNTVELVVIGTLKNTLGPHHAGTGVGSAWPGMFHQGPQEGPPPGAAYHTVSYGLFEPFMLQQLSPE
ncbi:MAG: glycosyl hydrolase [Thermoguttaceae bacterium]